LIAAGFVLKGFGSWVFAKANSRFKIPDTNGFCGWIDTTRKGRCGVSTFA
jgi:hypothetical protein